MNFIQANKVLKQHINGEPMFLQLSASGTLDPLLLYVRAYAAIGGKNVTISTLPFGTLGQALFSPLNEGLKEVILLMPWDVIPECDWRSGIPKDVAAPDILFENALATIARLKSRGSKIIFIDAPIPPIYLNPEYKASFKNKLLSLVNDLSATVLDEKYFSLSTYLASGSPISSSYLGEIASIIFNNTQSQPESKYKVLLTDLDNVLWSGLAAEIDSDGIYCAAEGKGYKHFIYQTLLAKLKLNGILIAAVSRNDLDVAWSPIKTGKTLLTETDFVEVMASYEPKSVHIKRLASKLNLGLDSFVFVDDNPVELAEIAAAIPQIHCVQFPSADDVFSLFINELSNLFIKYTISDEDKQRTELYKKRVDLSEAVINDAGGDLTAFLKQLQMELVIYKKTLTDSERAVQLINKTNQFNLNGRRVSDEEVKDILQAGGKLYSVKLDDRTGSHGEILVCLLDNLNNVVSLVLSCRVFQRKIEYAFVLWLLNLIKADIKLSYSFTERNTPIREFLKASATQLSDTAYTINNKEFTTANSNILEIFKIKEVGFD